MKPLLPGYALSVRQPWAWAIVHGGKDVENRTKLAITKGAMAPAGVPKRRVAIHASKGMTRDEYEMAREFMTSIGVVCPHPSVLIRGAIIGSVDVTGVVNVSSSRWFFGPWALTLENPAAEEPLACPGQLGVFFWEARAGGEIEQPLSWMKAWPGEHRRTATVALSTPDLFA